METLVTTPVLGSDVLVGKLVVYLALGLLSALIALGVEFFWFGVPFRGNLLLWLLATGFYLLACMGFSLVISSFTRSQQTSMVITLIALFIPGFLMSGLSDPISPVPGFSRTFALMLPTTHYILLSRGIALKGLSLGEMWQPLLALAVMGFAGLGAAIALFKKKLA